MHVCPFHAFAHGKSAGRGHALFLGALIFNEL